MEREKSIVILLTACVKPNCIEKISVCDVDQRKVMYIKTIKWYLEHTKYKICVCENSGVDLAVFFEQKYFDRLEILTYTTEKDCNPNTTRGYREMEILTYAVNNSRFIQETKYILKGTGRLILKNVNIIVSGHFRDARHSTLPLISGKWSGKDKWVDTRYIIFPKTFLREIIININRINLDNCFENVVSEEIYGGIKVGHYNFLPTCVPLVVSGIGAEKGNKYNTSFMQFIKECLKNLIARYKFEIGDLPNL